MASNTGSQTNPSAKGDAGTTQQASTAASPCPEYKEYDVDHIDDTNPHKLLFYYKQEDGDTPSFDLLPTPDAKGFFAVFKVMRAHSKSAVVTKSTHILSSEEVEIIKKAKKRVKKGHFKVEINKKAKLNLQTLFKPISPSSSSDDDGMELQE